MLSRDHLLKERDFPYDHLLERFFTAKRFFLRSSPGKRARPVISSAMMQPTDQMSTRRKRFDGKFDPRFVTSKSRHMDHYKGFQGVGSRCVGKIEWTRRSDNPAHFDPEHFIQIQNQNTKYVLCIKHYLLLDFKSLL